MRSRFAVSALLACLLFLTPFPAAGQWAPVNPESVALKVPPIPSPGAVWERAPLPLGSPMLGSALGAGMRRQPLVGDESLRWRLLPYALVGASIGGVLGYVVHEGASAPCNREIYLACPLRPYAYVVMGGAGGGAAGTLVGYLRERGQRRSPAPPSR